MQRARDRRDKEGLCAFDDVAETHRKISCRDLAHFALDWLGRGDKLEEIPFFH